MARVHKCLLLACLPVLVAIAGCSASAHEMSSAMLYPHAMLRTGGESPDDHYHRIAHIVDLDTRLLADDLDLLFMTDRSTRLSRWQAR